MRILILFIIALLFSCNNPYNNKEQNNIVSKPLSTLVDSLAILDSLKKHKPVHIDSGDLKPMKNISNKDVSKMPYSRALNGVSYDNINGKPILIQIDLPEKTYNKNTDTIPVYLNEYYTMMERYFSRSIADDFEHGISTEQIHYPTLHFTVQLFENEYAAKPYKIVEHTIYNERDKAEIARSMEVPVHNWAEQMPSIFPYKQDLRIYLQNNIIPPAKVKEKGISGISWLTFIVEKDGSISDLRIEQEFENCKECDEEALRVARSMPVLNPGIMNGQSVRVRIHQGINF